ncbi:hypothetical protein [Pimelobacter simplex]|uniref:hypothetical protein n=1 Tax=Nocardioides simplex TaxID=2045 RepID=UPI0021505AFF|nr:hypothetical protein [Pimelobacter simplex]UUW87387.1 hypothetical protein M0M43_16730 [Pimelobacter simplex]UUW96892.1 hypothetical protein M0M48_05375 [Pimelobacter simplex]
MRSLRVLIAVLLAGVLIGAALPAANAESPRPTKQVAKKLKCKRVQPMQIGAGPSASDGILCVAKVRPGVRQEFHVLEYPDIVAAVAFWRDWTSGYEGPPGCVTRKGSIIILSYGKPGVDDAPYTSRWCRYAAKRTGGRVIFGHPDPQVPS